MIDCSTLHPTFLEHGMASVAWTLLVCALPLVSMALAETGPAPQPVRHTVTPAYLQKNLRPSAPRLFLVPEYEDILRQKAESDPVVKNQYQAIRITVGGLTDEPVLTYNKEGRRLLGVSRDMLRRMSCLGMVWRLEKDTTALERINTEVNAVCDFPDWNPSHFLDVAEMAMAVALALDWTAGALPEPTVTKARQALLDKAIRPGLVEKGNWWIQGENNWNQVCHGGLTAAALVVADEHPDTAADIIARALDNLPHALVQYGPDGVYPEGPMYWSYGTAFTVLTIEMLRSALGTDFGLADYPSFKESALFRILAVSPSGLYFNYADCGPRPSSHGDPILAWFAAETGNLSYFEKEAFLRPPGHRGVSSRFAGPALVWLSRIDAGSVTSLPAVWAGQGPSPVAILHGTDSTSGFYLGIKGGRGEESHGNLDAGSFVFETDGVRWSVDPLGPGYHQVEQTGFDLWSRNQESSRWQLLAKNNFGHSTLTVNGVLHRVEGYGSITRVTREGQPEVELDLTPVFGDLTAKTVRTFRKESDRAVVIEDSVTVSESTRLLTWQMMTVADIEQTADGALLQQDGKKLRLEILGPDGGKAEVVPLDPPPHELDKRIDGLKRIEVRVPVDKGQTGSTVAVRVRLTGD